jgi:Lrp/AsnC family transcriptional regulator for asnA, asnC and gidA
MTLLTTVSFRHDNHGDGFSSDGATPLTDIDLIDRCIIALLQVDGRLSNAEVGRRLGVPEPTIRRRLKRLLDEEVMQVVAVPNPYKIGYIIHAVIGAKVRPGQVNEVVDVLTAMRQVRYVGVTAGAYDIVIEALFRDNDDLRVFLTETLGQIEGLRETETSYVLQVAKRSYRLGLASDIGHRELTADERELMTRCQDELRQLEEGPPSADGPAGGR